MKKLVMLVALATSLSFGLDDATIQRYLDSAQQKLGEKCFLLYTASLVGSLDSGKETQDSFESCGSAIDTIDFVEQISLVIYGVNYLIIDDAESNDILYRVLKDTLLSPQPKKLIGLSDVDIRFAAEVGKSVGVFKETMPESEYIEYVQAYFFSALTEGRVK